MFSVVESGLRLFSGVGSVVHRVCRSCRRLAVCMRSSRVFTIWMIWRSSPSRLV